MHIDRTKYTAHYENGILVSQWISVEMSLDSDESEVVALDRSKQIVEQWYKDNAPAFPGAYPGNIPPYGAPTPTIQVRPEDREVGVTPEQIMSCTDLIVLETYRLLIKGKPQLESAYSVRYNQLSAFKSAVL
jgi:hypothetical protein